MVRNKKHMVRRIIFSVIALVLLIFIAISLIQLYPKVVYPKKYSDYVEPIAEQNNIDKNLIYAIIKTESNFDPKAESDVGARGLMQLMSDAFDWVGYRMGDDSGLTYDSMYEPENNITYGTFMIKLLLDEYDDIPTALAAYHAGRGTVNNWLENAEYSDNGLTLKTIPSRTTGHYVSKVIKSYNGYTKFYNR